VGLYGTASYPPAITDLAMYSRESYESLSHRFVLASNDADLARRASCLIGEFARTVGDSPPGPGPCLHGTERTAAPMVYSLRSTPGADGRPRYTLDRGDQQVSASPDPKVVIGQLLWQISGDTVELADGYLLIHAGAVVTPAGHGVLILGESGSGKTTLVAALVQEGFGYLSDEAAAIELGTGLAHPWPPPLGFKHGSRSLPCFAALFPPESADPNATSTSERHVAIGQIRPGAIAGPCRVRHVIDHCYEPGAPTRLEPLSRALALVRMGSAAPRLGREGDRGLAVLAGVMREARTHRLISGDLERSVGAVRGQVGW
jgi:hypothetical protein